MTPQIAFAGSPIDRADHIRADPDALSALMNFKAKLLILDELQPALDGEGRLLWGSLADAPEDAELVFLGLDEGRACFAPVPRQGDQVPRMANPRLWGVMQAMTMPDIATYGAARALVEWHARHRFCASCGAQTQLAKGGWQRNCTRCSAEHFPRTDPVTIMLVERDGEILLGRGKNWPEGRYSALAGFVEPGETIEEAVAREVYEEAGLRVLGVRYIASQPWPFPSQLMIGCIADADHGEIVRDESELADARWFSRAEIEAALADDPSAPFIAPPFQAIARYLLSWWLAQ